MTIDDFISIFQQELEDVNPELIHAATDFKELEDFDSLVALAVISTIDDDFDILLSGDDMLASKTIEDLFMLCQSRT